MAVQIRRQHLMQVPTMLRHVILYAPSCEYLMRGPCNVIKHTEYGYDTLVAAEGRYITARRGRVQTLVRLRMHVRFQSSAQLRYESNYFPSMMVTMGIHP